MKFSKPYPKKICDNSVKVAHIVSNDEEAGQYRPYRSI